MRRARLSFALLVLLALVPGGVIARPPGAGIAAPAWGWTLVASMAQERIGHSATPLGDGRILVAGGFSNSALATAEVYDPRADRWTPTGPMVAPRSAHLAARLSNGRVVVAGGFFGRIVAPFAEVYDPVTNSWSPLGPTLDSTFTDIPLLAALPDGRIFVVETETNYRRLNVYATSAAVFDPATGALVAVTPPPTSRLYPTLTVLRDGRILVAGGAGDLTPAPHDGDLTTVEIYDLATDRWVAAAPLGIPRRFHAATALADGRVLVIGGYTPRVGETSHASAAELYDPASDRWTPTGTMTIPHATAKLTLLPDSRIIATGIGTQETNADDNNPQLRVPEVYNPATGRWAVLPPMLTRRGGHTATALPDGQVLVIGGYGGPQDRAIAQSAERYGPGSSTGTCFFQTGRCLDGRFLAHWQAHGGLAINGYPLTNPREERLEDGKLYTVQYFERVRMEYHPENAPPYDVLLGQFGRRILAGVPGAPTAPVAPLPGTTHFPQTGHNVGPRFLAHWQVNGGLAQFGYPLSEEFEERLEDGKTYRVQYFERARFEYHPENRSPNDILLGQFGRRILAEVDAGR